MCDPPSGQLSVYLFYHDSSGSDNLFYLKIFYYFEAAREEPAFARRIRRSAVENVGACGTPLSFLPNFKTES
jgi:hypothetical protein